MRLGDIMEDNEVKTEQIKIIKINLIVCLICFILSSFCFFFGWISYPLGFLLGALCATIDHLLLFYFSGEILKQGSNVKFKAFIYYLSRILIFALGLTICLLLDYFKLFIFSWITYLIPFFSLKIVLVIIMRK